MSTSYGPIIKFRHSYDCLGMESCPSHTLQMRYHHTSDMIQVWMDGELLTVEDPAFLKALAVAKALGQGHGPNTCPEIDITKE